MPDQLQGKIDEALSRAEFLAGHLKNREQIEILAAMTARGFSVEEMPVVLTTMLADYLSSIDPSSVPAPQISDRIEGEVHALIPAPVTEPIQHTIVYEGTRFPGDYQVIYGFADDAKAKAWGMEYVSPSKRAWHYVEAVHVDAVG